MFNKFLFHFRINLYLGKTGMKITPTSIRREMNDFLPHINFLKMSSDYFITHVLTTEIFTTQESLSILRKMNEIEDEFTPEFIVKAQENMSLCEEDRPIHSVMLIKFPQCNTSFFYNNMDDTFSDKIIILKVSENVFITSIKLRSNCFTGSWKIHLASRDEKEIGVSSNDYSPWIFDRPVQLVADRSYMCRIEGRGRRAKHRVVDYESFTDGINFTGIAINCPIVIFYLT